MSYITYDEFMRHMTLETLVRKARQDWKGAMEKHNHEDHSRNWPPPQNLLDSFKYEVGGKLFTLFRYPGCDRVQLKMSRDQASEGLVIECVATIGPEFDATLACHFEHVSAVAAAIPRAEVFLRNLYEKQESEHTERAPLPDGCDWINSCFEEVTIRDNRYMALYALPLSERQAAIFDALAKEFRRTHPSK